MATPLVTPSPTPLTSYQLPAEMQAWHQWVVSYIESVNPTLPLVDGKSLRQVVVVGIKDFKPGGGGLFCKKEDKEENYAAMKSAALVARANAEEITKGHFLLVRNDQKTAGAKATLCFILWHEFGHALAAYGVGSNAGELSAWRFEMAAITHAVKTGLPQAITKDMVWGYLDVRRRKGNLKGAEDLITLLETALGAKPTEITQGYCDAAKACDLTMQGEFDIADFKLAMAARWGTQTGPKNWKNEASWVLTQEQKAHSIR